MTNFTNYEVEHEGEKIDDDRLQPILNRGSSEPSCFDAKTKRKRTRFGYNVGVGAANHSRRHGNISCTRKSLCLAASSTDV